MKNSNFGGTTIILKKKRLISIFVVFIILFSLINHVISTSVVAQQDETPDKPKGLLQWFGRLSTFIFSIIRGSHPHFYVNS